SYLGNNPDRLYPCLSRLHTKRSHPVPSSSHCASARKEDTVDKVQSDRVFGAANDQVQIIRRERLHELMNEREAAAYLGVSVSGMRKWRARQSGPKYARFGKIIRYRRSDLDAFVQSRIVV